MYLFSLCNQRRCPFLANDLGPLHEISFPFHFPRLSITSLANKRLEKTPCPSLPLVDPNRKYWFKLSGIGAYTILLHDPAIGPVNFYSNDFLPVTTAKVHLPEDYTDVSFTYKKKRLSLRDDGYMRCDASRGYSYLKCWQKQIAKIVSCRTQSNR